MSIRKLLSALTVAGAAGLVLSGCVVSAPIGDTSESSDTDGGTSATSEAPATSEAADASDALVDTDWSGSVTYPGAGELTLRWSFQEDGTLYIYDWGDTTDANYDVATDTWAVDGDQITIYLSGIEDIEGLTFTGTAPTASDLSLSGTDDLGDANYTLTMTKQ